VCLKTPLTARQEVCSGKCRVAWSRQRKAAAARARARKIREYLLTAEESLQAIRDLLGEGGGEDP